MRIAIKSLISFMALAVMTAALAACGGSGELDFKKCDTMLTRKASEAERTEITNKIADIGRELGASINIEDMTLPDEAIEKARKEMTEAFRALYASHKLDEGCAKIAADEVMGEMLSAFD